MSTSRFIQVHFLTSYPASLLNRDDVGFAKRLPFGGATRTRISSQCLKRHWRCFEGEHALSAIRVDGKTAPMSVRSRVTFERFVREPLEKDGVSPALATAVTEAIMSELLGESAKAKKERAAAAADKPKKGKKGNGEAAPEAPAEREALATGQVTVLGRPELEFLLDEARAVAAKAKSSDGVKDAMSKHFTKERQENLRALKRGAGLDAALFGRMVTSDILSRTDAAVHVAHAFTVHGEASESDYFSAVDDLLKSENELGSGHIGTTELTSGLFYGYVVVDVPLLVSNLEGGDRSQWQKQDRALAAEVVQRFVQLVATVSPGAKLGSTAPYAYAHLVLVEAGNAQPRTLANAFLRPVSERPDIVANSYAALARHLADLDGMYGASTERRLAALGDVEPLRSLGAERMSLEALAKWSADRVRT